MTREEAILILGEFKEFCDSILWNSIYAERSRAIDMAIEALHREEAEAKGYCHRIIPKPCEVYEDYEHATLVDIKEPLKVSVVRCKDCKHWLQHEQFGFDEDNDEYHDYCGLLIPEDEYYAYTRKSDDYCSYGERKGGDTE